MRALVLALATAAGLQIDGSSECPRPEAVAERLREIAGPTPAGRGWGAGERVELERDAEVFSIRLRDGAGVLLGERRLPGRDCDALAQAAAVLIAAWRTDAVPAAPRVELRRRPARRPVGWEVSAAFLGATNLTGGVSFAPGGAIAAALGRAGGRAFGRLELFGLGLRAIAVGSQPGGYARFTRAGLTVGPLVRFRPGRFLIDLRGDLTPALIYVDSVGFTSGGDAYDFDLGLGGGARAAVRAGPLTPYLSIGVIGWLLKHRVEVTGMGGGVMEVPRLELLLQAGLAFGTP
jgi:hypothetical protein